jgi:uncharacterized membrane protein
MKSFNHWLLVIGAIAIGTWLRFSHLALKPLWQDEVITALLSLGQGYRALPFDQIVSLSAVSEVFTLKPTTCAAIAELVKTQSVHPPLFFCAMHEWLAAVQTWPQSLVWKLRALPAIAGVGTIAAMYALNRIAFSRRAGLVAAWVMAVSPFAVYLSQEARHYTIPMLLIAIVLVCLVKIHQDWQVGRSGPIVWLLWVGINSLGFYVHYFFILAVIAQILTLAGIWLGKPAGNKLRLSPSSVGLPIVAITLLGLTYLPWWPTFFGHLNRPETDWLKPFEPSWVDAIAPLWQFPIGWLLMVIALPIEQQPLWIAIPAVLLTLIFAIWLIRHVIQRLKILSQNPISRGPLIVLANFIGWVLIEFLAIVFFLHKDITQIPRYNFIYYPAVCALLGALFSIRFSRASEEGSGIVRKWKLGQSPITDYQLPTDYRPVQMSRRPTVILILVGLVSSCLVTIDQVLHKPFYPAQVAQQITADQLAPEQLGPILVVMSYENLQDVALGTSFALALQQVEGKSPIAIAMMTRSPGYEQLWQKLATLPAASTFPDPQALWIIGPGLRQREFPAQIALAQASCGRDPAQFHRIGIPYQGYRCSNVKN